MFGGGIGNGEEGRHDTTTSRWTLPRLWDGRRVVGWETACRSSENENGNGNGGDCTGSDAADAGIGVMVRRLREKVIEYLRASWLVDVLGIGGEEALLVMHRPMQSSLSHGKLEVVKWLFERFRFERELHETAFCDLYNVCALGVSPSNFKWCLENFPVGPRRDSLTCTLVPNKHSTVQDCQLSCVEDYLRENGYPFILEIVCNPDVVKWLLTTFPPHPPPSEDELNHVCMNTGNVELTQWLVTEHHFTPTAATFASACSTSRKKGSTLAKWLSTRVSLSQSDINKSLVCALNWSNIKVAEWLDETFHVMDVVNSNTQVAENFLIDLCKESTDYEDKVVGLEWFLKRLSPSQASKITMTCIHEAVSQALEEPRANSVALLLEMFTAFEPHKDMEQFKNIVTVFLRYHLNGFQSLCTGSGSAVLTPEFVGDCLTSESFYPYSSKVVKWVIRKFNVQYTQIKANNNQLLFRLLTRRKNRCAQWLIESFNIPLSDILAMAKLGDESGASIDLTGWHMILNHYGPTIDAALIRKHLMPLVSRSPHVAIHAISSFGLTKSEIRDYVDVQSRDPNGDTFSAEVNLWHGMPFHPD
ncbi:hypothetical protein Pelo_17314 [Pelomyxa schiedti]|nr:hypothetical protein Pelo_17314 [Pelomyxa schiedti]